MKCKKINNIIMLLSIIIISTLFTLVGFFKIPSIIANAENDIYVPNLTVTPDGANNKVNLSWNTSPDPIYRYMIYQKDSSESTESFQSIPLKNNISVLNVYPDLDKSNSCETWMKQYGSNIEKGYTMSVTAVKLSDFNINFNANMKNEDGSYKYDVIYFGACDRNNNLDLSNEAKAAVEKFIVDGGGCLLGHDTASFEHSNFIDLAEKKLNMDVQYVANYAEPGNYGPYGDESVVVNKKGLLMNYPYELGNVGTILHTPLSHSYYQFAMGDVWFKYKSNTAYTYNESTQLADKRIGTNNFYLTTWNNVAMIQTGHSSGTAYESEQQILANTLYYLAQVTTTNSATDRMSQDLAEPNAVNKDSGVTRVTADDSNNVTVQWTATTDNGSSYDYYLKAIAASGLSIQSDTKSATVTTGVAGYAASIDSNQSGSTGAEINTNTNSFSKNLAKGNYYIHIKTIDGAGNISSATSDCSFTVCEKPTIITQPMDTTTRAGSTVTLSVDASVTDGGSLSYRWQRSTDSGKSWEDVSGANSKDYSIAKVALSDRGSCYQCVVTNINGISTSTKTSDKAILTVNSAPIAGFGNAISLDGTGYVDCGANNSDLKLGTTFTEEAWIYLPSTGDNVYHGFLGNEPDETSEIKGANGRAPGMWVFENNKIHMGFGDGTDTPNNGGWKSTITPNSVLEMGSWNHIAATYNGTNYKLYVNGNLVLNTSMSAISGDAPFRYIGCVDNWFTGRMDEVSVWKTALSEATIKEWMNKPIDANHPNYPSLVGYWQFNKGQGTTAAGKGTFTEGGYKDVTGTLKAGASWIVSDVPLIYYVKNGGNIPINLIGYDEDGDELKYTIVTQPTHGKLEGSGASYVYTHTDTENLTSTDWITYKVNDGTTDSGNTATVKLVIAKPILPPPTMTPADGKVNEGVSVKLFCSITGASIYYTLDGSTPTTSNSTLYSSSNPIDITKTTIIKAIAIKSGYIDSKVTEVQYSVNSAPVLTKLVTTLSAIDEDNINSSGTKVSDLLSGIASDLDHENLGIAITSADTSKGIWQYYYDNEWKLLSTAGEPLSEATALLLTPDMTIRFVPDADYYGSADMKFRAWDGTTESNVGRVDVTKNGGSTAYSAEVGTATITVNSINDAPVIGKDLGNKLLQFDGSDDYVQISNDINLNDSFTMEAWIYINSTPESYARIFDFGAGQQKYNQWFGFYGNTGRMEFETWSGTASSTYQQIITSDPLPLKQWVYVTAVYNESEKKAYIYWNGKLIQSGSMDLSGEGDRARTSNYIGKSNWDIDKYFAGYMRDTAIWNDARTAEEISNDMNRVYDGNEGNLVLYYPLKEDLISPTIQNVKAGTYEGTLKSGLSLTKNEIYDYHASGFSGESIAIDQLYLKDDGENTLSLSVANGALTFETVTGLTGTGTNGSDHVTVSGSVNDLNAALKTLKYCSNSDFKDEETINVTVTDDENLTDTKNIVIFIYYVYPIITLDVADIQVNEGETAHFTVEATVPPGKDISYQWQSYSNGNWENILGATNSEYNTNVLSSADNGAKYKCIVTNSSDNRSKASSTATLTVAPVIKGVVKYNNGKAVSGAAVTLTDIIDTGKKYTEMTDASGNYLITGVPDGTYNIKVTKDSKTTDGGNITVNGSSITKNITNVPNPVYVVGGNVKYSNGNVVSGAAVTLTDTIETSKKYTETTDASGNYLITGVLDGSYSIKVTKDSKTTDGGNITVNGSSATKNITNIPNPVYVVGGKVKYSNGNVVSGAAVTLTDTIDTSKKYIETTDASGNYLITGVPDGTYNIKVTKDSKTTDGGNITVSGSSITKDIMNVPNPVYVVGGKVKYSNGNVVSGAAVTLTDTIDTGKKYAETTDASGNYSITGVPDGSYNVIVIKNSSIIYTGSVAVNGSDIAGVSGDILIPVTPPIESTFTITGMVIRSDSSVVSGSAITLTAKNDPTKTYTETTDASGKYSFVGIPNGNYTVVIINNNSVLYTGDITVNGSDVSNGSGDITIPETPPVTPPVKSTFTVAGTIKNSNASAVSGSAITLTAKNDPTKTYTETTDASGKYSFAEIPNGIYTVAVINNNSVLYTGDITVNGSDVSNGSGDITIPETPPVTPPVEPVFTVIGMVISNDNSAVSGSAITLTDNSDPTKTYTGTIDAVGNYNIPGVKNGSYTVTVIRNNSILYIGNAVVNNGNIAGGSGAIIINQSTSTSQASEATNKSEKVSIDVKVGESEEIASVVTIERQTETNGRKKDTVIYEEESAAETIEMLHKEGKDSARIVIQDIKDEVSETNVKIPTSALNILAAGNIDLVIETENAKINIPEEGLKNTDKASLDELYFDLVPIKEEEEQNQIIERAKEESIVKSIVEDGTISVIGRPMTIETNMPESPVDIILPLKGVIVPTDPKEREEFFSTLVVYIEHSDGDKEIVGGEIVEYEAGILGIKFRINKFSTFTIIKVDQYLQKSHSCDLVKVESPSKTVIKGQELSLTVKNDTAKVKINVTVSENANWKLYSDSSCENEIANKYMKLKVGENKAYIKVLAEDGTSSMVYTITVTRNKKTASKVAIIATNLDFADAYAGNVWAKQLGCKVKTFGYSDKAVHNIVKYLTKNFAVKDTIYIMGLGQAIRSDVDKIMKDKGYKHIIRIGGEDKYETAEKICHLINPVKGTSVMLVNGDKMPEDGEKINSLCIKNGYPILYVKTDSIAKSTLEELYEFKPSKIYIIGNQSQISNKAVKKLQKILGIKSSDIIRIKSRKDIID